MCGIFGYIGKQNNAAETIFEGLKQLEYRGYDSWGVAIKKDKKISVEKQVGKIGNHAISLPQSSLGIGHTRWATHGGVTLTNAHPHLDCTETIAVIHNGIIENFEEIKEELLKKGHEFKSETDTEVVVHLVEENLKRSQPAGRQGFASSVRDGFNRLKGLNAIVVLNTRSKEIIAAKNGSPLVVGKSENELFLASDAAGILPHTKQLLFLKDNEMVILGKDVQLLSLPKGRKLHVVFETVDWEVEDVDKGSFAHFMLKEIHEQPKVIRNIAENYDDQINILAGVIAKAKGTFFIGSGTAFHACMVGAYLFSKIVQKHVNTAAASEFNYLEDFLTKDSLVIALSQSGETIDVVEPLVRAKKRGSIIFAITNALGSTIYRLADYKMLLGAGPEKAVASTKAYVAKLSILLLLAYTMVDKQKEGKRLLLDASDEITRFLKKENVEQFEKIASLLKNAEHIYTIGRGVSYPTALEAAMKIKEVSYIHTEGFAGGELKHGTIALIEKGTPCIVFAPVDKTYEATLSNAMEIKARGGVIIGVSSKRTDVFDHFIEVKDSTSTCVISQIVPAQILAYLLALNKGHDPDKPRNLAKSVTVK